MLKKLFIVLFCALVLLGGLFGYMGYMLKTTPTTPPAPTHPYFADLPRRVLVIAHRGGAGLWPENTLYAFERAAEMGVDVLELDVHTTADGVLVVMHDSTVERTTDGAGAIRQMTLAELQRLDAGYRWTPDAGQTFPLRGKGLRVPTLAEVFDASPRVRFNIEPKQQEPSLTPALCQMIRERGLTNRVLIGSFTSGVLEEFRRDCAEVATSASTSEVATFMALNTAHVGGAQQLAAKALQVPEYAGGVHVLTKNFIDAAHARNLQVHAWTINQPEHMQRIIALGVDGIMTDYPDRLLTVLANQPAP